MFRNSFEISTSRCSRYCYSKQIVSLVVACVVYNYWFVLGEVPENYLKSCTNNRILRGKFTVFFSKGGREQFRKQSKAQ